MLPGVICVALVQQKAFGGEAPPTSADTYTFLITHLLPVGLKGLVAAAMLAAAMQTCSAALNSTATLVAYDLCKRRRPDLGDHQLVRIGKITTVAGTILARLCSPLFGHYSTIFEGINKLISYVAPPITAVFLLGVFWRRASGKAAFITLVTGMGLGAVAFIFDFFKTTITRAGATAATIAASPVLNFIYNVALKDFMLAAFGLLVACLLIMVAATLVFPEPLKAEARLLVWDSWREPLRGPAVGRGLANFRVVAVAILAGFIALYALFR